MVEEKIIKQIEEDFSFLKDKVLGVVLFGSQASNEANQRSDIDICIIAPNKNPKDVLREVWRNVDVKSKNYDVWVFEELPLYMKMSVIKNHVVVLGDKYEISEYFYKYRKLWKDQERRNRIEIMS